jgi:DNA-binding GntR family transcriptional regulator
MPALSTHIDGMWQAFPWDLMLNTAERTRQSHQEHIAIMQAIKSGDVAAVAAATEAHIARVFDAIARRINGEGHSLPDPFLLDTD